MSRPRRKETLFIECRGCHARTAVRGPYEQRKRKFCSHRCAAIARDFGPVLKRAAQNSVATRKRKVLARVAGMTALEAFYHGYHLGVKSKLRQIRERYQLVAITEPATSQVYRVTDAGQRV